MSNKGKAMRLYSILLMVVLMAGCAAAPSARIHYTHPTAGHERFGDVSYQCGQKARTVISKAQVTGYGETSPEVAAVDCDQFNACMEKQGFTRSPDGPFLTSKDLQLNCR
jgi:hypothetical protein